MQPCLQQQFLLLWTEKLPERLQARHSNPREMPGVLAVCIQAPREKHRTSPWETLRASVIPLDLAPVSSPGARVRPMTFSFLQQAQQWSLGKEAPKQLCSTSLPGPAAASSLETNTLYSEKIGRQSKCNNSWDKKSSQAGGGGYCSQVCHRKGWASHFHPLSLSPFLLVVNIYS